MIVRYGNPMSLRILRAVLPEFTWVAVKHELRWRYVGTREGSADLRVYLRPGIGDDGMFAHDWVVDDGACVRAFAQFWMDFAAREAAEHPSRIAHFTFHEDDAERWADFGGPP